MRTKRASALQVGCAHTALMPVGPRHSPPNWVCSFTGVPIPATKQIHARQIPKDLTKPNLCTQQTLHKHLLCTKYCGNSVAVRSSYTKETSQVTGIETSSQTFVSIGLNAGFKMDKRKTYSNQNRRGMGVEEPGTQKVRKKPRGRTHHKAVPSGRWAGGPQESTGL